MAQLMADPLDPNAHDDRTPAAADDAPALVPETAPVETSAAVGGDDAAAREAAAHFGQSSRVLFKIFLGRNLNSELIFLNSLD